MATLQEQLDAKRDKYAEEGTWMRFLIEAFMGNGGFMGRIKQPPAGWWGSAAEAYSSFSVLKLLSASSAAAEIDSYLDRHPREDAERFERRKNVAHYLNYVRPTTMLKCSYVARKPHMRNNVPDELKAWIERTKYDAEFKQRALRSAVLGWWPMLVDKPARPAGAVSEAQAGNMDPYTVAMLPCALYDYQLDEKGVMLWAKLGTTYTERESPLGESVTIRRYVLWTRTEFRVWESRQIGSGAVGEPVPKAQGTHPFKAVPLVSWRAETSVEDRVKADSINADIAVEARRLFNLLSEFDEFIRGQAFAILVNPMRPVSGETTVALGPSSGLIVDPEQKNMPFYLAPPGSIAETFETRITNSIIEIYRMARVEYDRASGTKSSAQSKEQNFEQTNLAIADFAAGLAAADRETLILIGRGMGISEEKLQAIECTPHPSYETQELNDDIAGVVELLTLSMGNTFKGEILKRLASRALPGLSADTRQVIEGEIDAAVIEAEQEKALMVAAEREALKKDPPPDGGDETDDDEDPAQAAE